MTIGSVRDLFREQLHTHYMKLKSSNTTFLIRLSSKKLVSLMSSTPLAEKRSVDDQLEWPDNKKAYSPLAPPLP